ncbi:hypothetical protein N7508_005152 [Penicillium antarcticum]|uniref:uncharacterized protein n=1 Tax=Penicillium antarcticum TaxID=416450 RepID=UPI002387A237|nr:uncharacterized protein N7508_005152 [Penicillium antarcticum]KAJ5306137.1 hypothetical protein N7508_005152 [Penicillium antarcticum]
MDKILLCAYGESNSVDGSATFNKLFCPSLDITRQRCYDCHRQSNDQASRIKINRMVIDVTGQHIDKSRGWRLSLWASSGPTRELYPLRDVTGTGN